MAKINAFRLLEEFPVEIGGDKMIFIGEFSVVETRDMCDEIIHYNERILIDMEDPSI